MGATKNDFIKDRQLDSDNYDLDDLINNSEQQIYERATRSQVHNYGQGSYLPRPKERGHFEKRRYGKNCTRKRAEKIQAGFEPINKI